MTRVVRKYDVNGNEVSVETTNAEEANIITLIGKANTALATNATFLAIASPTAAQVATQTKALSRQVDTLIRLQLALVTTITDT